MRFSVVLNFRVIQRCSVVLRGGIAMDWASCRMGRCFCKIDCVLLVIDWCRSWVCWNTSRRRLRLLNLGTMAVGRASYGDLYMAASQGRAEGEYGEK